MKKFFAVLLWIGLAVCVIMLVSLAGEKAALREENRKAQQKYDALKTVYDREKAEWKSAAEDMSADNTALTLEKQSLAAALKTAQEEMEAVEAERETLTAEKNEASGRLSEILAVLLPQEEAEKEPDGPALPSPAAAQTELLPL